MASQPAGLPVLDGEAGESAATMQVYRISGLLVHSEIVLPAAFPATGHPGPADVVIRHGRLPEHLDNLLASGPDWESSEASFLFRVPGVANFLIQDKSSVWVQASVDSDPGDITLYLLGTCLAILLQQRGNLVLHASAIAVRDRAMLFCGASGAGKSTMAALLCRHGYSLLNDDTCNVTQDQHARFVVSGDGRMLKLWAQSLDRLALRPQQVEAVRRDTDKFYTTPDRSDFVPRPVSAIYLLETTDLSEAPSLELLSRLQGTTALRENAYRPALVEAMQQEVSFFETSARLQQQAGVYRLRRALDFSQAEAVVALLEAHWANLDAASTK